MRMNFDQANLTNGYLRIDNISRFKVGRYGLCRIRWSKGGVHHFHRPRLLHKTAVFWWLGKSQWIAGKCFAGR